jgi:arylsulfatase A-like enzyme
MCHHKAPHREWEPPLRYLGHDHDRSYPEPETLFDDYAGRGKAERAQDMTIAQTLTDKDLKFVPPSELSSEERRVWNAYYEPRNAAFRAAKLQGKDLVRWKYNRYLHDYLGCIQAVDESVGRLLSLIDQEGLSENTIVVYAADQGFFLGEHGWFDKRWIFEQSLRAPFLLRWPREVRPGSHSDRIVSNLDFAETFLEAAGLPIPAEMQGRSLLPLLRGEAPADWRTSFYYHYYEFPGPHSVHRHYGVVTDRYKLVRFYEPEVNEWELFDLKSDPLELKSIYREPGLLAVKQGLSSELVRLRGRLRVPFPDPEPSMIK